MNKFLNINGSRLGRVALFGLILLLPNQAWAGKNVFKFFEDMEIHGFVSSSYSYNFNKPLSQTNCGFTPGGCIRIFSSGTRDRPRRPRPTGPWSPVPRTSDLRPDRGALVVLVQ